MKILIRRFTLSLCFLVAITAARAQSGTPQSPYLITGPTTITQAGYYRLQNNINSSQTSGYIIDVEASNVTIDFNGFYIAGPVGNSNQTTYGIYAVERSNLTVFNGTIAFCGTGIAVGGTGAANTNSVGHRYERMRITYCYYTGIGITDTPSTLVEANQISKIGGRPSSSAYGMNVVGKGVTIRNNLISNVTSADSYAYAIIATSGFIVGNTISDISGINGDPNHSFGIAGGVAQNNLFYACPTSFSGLIDGGGNAPIH